MPILITLPIFLIIFVGWLLRRNETINEGDIHSLNNFAYYISLPALIVSSLWNIDFLSSTNLGIIQFSVVSILLFSLLLLLVLSLTKLSNDLKALIYLIGVTGNTIYMGFPLVEAELGKNYLSSGALVGTIYLIFPLLISIFAIHYWRDRDYNLTKELIEFIKNPLIISIFVGVGFSFLNINYPIISSIKNSLLMLGATASPVALFVLGGFIYGKFLKNSLGLALFLTSIKIIIFPVFVIFVYYLFGTPASKVSILLASMPAAITTFIISEKFKLNSGLTGNVILISTILSFIIIPIIAYSFNIIKF